MQIANPLLSSMEKTERTSSEKASFNRILIKIFYFFILMIISGVPYYYGLFGQYNTTIAYVSMGCIIVFPILAFFFKRMSFIFGSIYSLAQGIIVVYFSRTFSTYYSGAVPIAIVVSLVVFLICLFLYSTGIVKVGHRFRSIVRVSLLSAVIITMLVFISRMFTPTIYDIFYGGGMFSIGISLFMVVIAAFSLITDMDNIAIIVRSGRDKSLEWLAAFSFSMSVIWLYLRILELVALVMGRDNN